MTEIPEHLRKRAEDARKKAQEKSGGADAPAADAPAADAPAERGGEAAPQSEAASRIPAHLLERSKAAKDRASGATTTADAPVPVAAAAGGTVATAAPPVAAGPG